MADEKLRVYGEAEVAAKLAEHGLTGWYYEDGWIRRKFNTDGWPATLMLVNAVRYLAEAAWHHPDLTVTWGKVWIKLKTHSAGRITDRDFALARQIHGANHSEMAEAARWLEAYGISSVDINMGCPVHKVVRGGGGSAMMRDAVSTVGLVRTVVEAVRIPVTVKMRLGWDEETLSAP